MRDDDQERGCEHVECALYEFWMRGSKPRDETGPLIPTLGDGQPRGEVGAPRVVGG